MTYVKFILGNEDDNGKMPLLNYDMKFSLVGRLSTDKPVKYMRLGVYFQLGILSMGRRIEMKTQVVCKTFQLWIVLITFGHTIKGLKEALSSFKDPSFQFVKQSANQVFYSLAKEVVSVTDCKEWLIIPLNFAVNRFNYD